MRSLFWFRQDLRLADNTGLYHAAHNADDGLLFVYLICIQDWLEHVVSPVQIDFILRCLADLKSTLEQKGFSLEIIQVKQRIEIAPALLALMQANQITTLVANKQYEINENKRDDSVKALLNEHGLKFARYDDLCILPPGSVLTQKDTAYTVFTPFKKRWAQIFKQSNYLSQFKLPNNTRPIKINTQPIPNAIPGIERRPLADIWPAGERAAHARLDNFLDDAIRHYHQQRDFPALTGTSQLSPYLACGVISIRRCFEAALDANKGFILEGNQGITTWLSELIWREFYKHILFHFPRVCRHQAFKIETDNFQWTNNERLFNAWCAGQTGYPFIDAAMRQLNQTAWMHNRLRMLVAMFLTKDLLIDWRWGERYFSQQLIDLDLSANNGGWQWAASSGTDAAPYFRIFNPITQSEKFDKQGAFIKQYCPELQSLSAKDIHFPADELRLELGYPLAIVNHKQARDAFLSRYKQDVK